MMPLARALPSGFAAGLAAALLMLGIASGTLGGVMLVALSSLPLYLAGFGAGRGAFAIAIIAAIGATTVVAGVPAGGAMLLLGGIPSATLTLLAIGSPAPSAHRLVLGLTVLGVVAFAVSSLGGLGVEGGLQAVMQDAFTQALAHQEAVAPLPVDVGPVVMKLAYVAAGLMIGTLMLLAAIDAALAQGVLVRFGHNLRPTPPMASLDLPWWISVAFAAALAAWLFGTGQIAFAGANLAIILAVPLILGGLAVIHMAVRRHPARLVMLIGVYGIAVASGGWLFVPMVALGIVEQWLGLRRRLAVGSSRGEK